MNGGPADSSITADLRRKLSGVTVTDGQLSAMTDAQRRWTKEQLELDQDAHGLDYDVKKQAIDAARDEEFRKALGADAFAQYEKQQDEEYRTLKHFATAWQLSDGDVEYLYHAIQTYHTQVRDYERRARALQQQGQAVDWKSVQADIQQYSQQAQKSLATDLGPERFNKMKRHEFLFSMQQSPE